MTRSAWTLMREVVNETRQYTCASLLSSFGRNLSMNRGQGFNLFAGSWSAPCPMPDPGEFCLNGGTCLFFEQVREPACKCPEGFNGQRCENKDVSNRSSMYHSYRCKLGLSTLYYC
ncbi:hypothetical protein EVAR_39401_1 [Eumeta japonica]|uniref:EGF-like domain-containing protein n=1 Tax=Eumeta variegata TaxID=151549 RepID=A0A4C1Z003_EUMVA|nr:hypothetical protein EVAR_39401_1 [Eumeta japonica]